VALATAMLAVAAVSFVGLAIADAVFPFPEGSLHRPPSTVIRDRDGLPLRIFLAPDEHYRMPVRLDDVAPELVASVVESEDRWYWAHPGVNPLAIVRAAWANLRAGEVISGASTIPMQIARMVHPKPRTVRGKLVEALRALQLDWHHDKEELLEIYLNLAPYGGNLEGVGAASWFYFGKAPAQLSLGEAALLTALPRSPWRYDPTRNPATAREARDRVLEQLAGRGLFDGAAFNRAAAQDIPHRLQAVPFEAPHFADYVYRSLPAGTPSVITTLDLRQQKIVEAKVASHIDTLRRQGIHNAAVVVIENDSRAVRAMVGSADFFDAVHHGQVNNAVSQRSPGSTLKPFVYVRAFDEGLIIPDSYLLDVPTDFSGYIAQNYDGEYRGRVLARDALRLSLNASAVRLLSRVGLEDFHAMLVSAGLLSPSRPALHYGLPLILGAGEVRLLDLTNLYATLALGGLHGAPRLLADEDSADQGGLVAGPRLFSAGAASLVGEILSTVERPDMPQAWDLTYEVPPVAWKTGTSFGHRDAWAVGFSGRLTIGVWVGNPDGRGQEGISGAQHAGPLLFDLFRALEPRGLRAEPESRARLASLRVIRELTKTEVCADSHQLPGPFCPRLTEVVTLADRSRLPVCELHRRVFVDAEDGDLLLGDCLRRRPSRSVVLSLYPAELTGWWRARGHLDFDEVPPLSASCRDVPDADPPRIVSPDSATPYLVRQDAPLDHQRIPLVARVAGGAARLYWYQDGVLVAAGPPDTSLFLDPEPGLHRLVVVDSAGRADSISYRVE
jgi:penicillin-binding protein 1C